MKVTGRTVRGVLGVCWLVSLGQWAYAGHHPASLVLVPLLAVLQIPLVATVFYLGHRHGYDQRQTELRAAVERARRGEP